MNKWIISILASIGFLGLFGLIVYLLVLLPKNIALIMTGIIFIPLLLLCLSNLFHLLLED